MSVVDGVQQVGTALPGVPGSAAVARSLVRRTLAEWDLRPLTDTAVLLVSELATNAFLHAGTDLEVRVERTRSGVRVSVLDDSPRVAARRRHGPQTATGRGLGMVEALSTAWGSFGPADRWAKAVWFELPADTAALPKGDEGQLYGDDWLVMVDEL